MKEKIGRLFDWGMGTYQIVMKSKLVGIGCFFVQGMFHTFSPAGSLRWDAGILSALLAFYALMSLIFVLSNRSVKVEKGKALAGSLVRGFFDDKRDAAEKHQTLLSKNRAMEERKRLSESLTDKRRAQLADKRDNKRNVSKAVLLVNDFLLLVIAVLLFIWRDPAVYIVHILIGVGFILDGATGLYSVAAATKSRLPVRYKRTVCAVSALTLTIGVLFVVLSWDSAEFFMRLSGVLMLVKAFAEGFVMIRNKEVFASAKDTIHAIKEQ